MFAAYAFHNLLFGFSSAINASLFSSAAPASSAAASSASDDSCDRGAGADRTGRPYDGGDHPPHDDGGGDDDHRAIHDNHATSNDQLGGPGPHNDHPRGRCDLR